MNSSSSTLVKQPEKALPRLRLKLRLPNGKSGCSLKELCDWADLSPTQIRHLESKELIAPKRIVGGKKRRSVVYSAEDVLKTLIISDIRHAGFSLQELRTAIHNLRKFGLEFNAQTHLLTDGASIQAASSELQVVDILRHERQLMLLVSIEDQIEKVQRVA